MEDNSLRKHEGLNNGRVTLKIKTFLEPESGIPQFETLNFPPKPKNKRPSIITSNRSDYKYRAKRKLASLHGPLLQGPKPTHKFNRI